MINDTNLVLNLCQLLPKHSWKLKTKTAQD